MNILKNASLIDNVTRMQQYWKSVDDDLKSIAKINNENFVTVNENMKELEAKLDKILKILENGNRPGEAKAE